jgi:uncharacterized membrane protein YdbT with pleckstrin-like domain
MAFEDPDLTMRLITPLIIGGIAGLTITCTLFPRVFDRIEKEVEKRKGNTNNGAETSNEGRQKGEASAEVTWETQELHFHNNEKWVLALFGLSIVILILPFLYVTSFPYTDFIKYEKFNITIVQFLVISAYLLIIFALIILINTYYLMATLRSSIKFRNIPEPSEETFKFLKMMGPS